MTREIELAPSKIRFMQNRINSRFTNGDLLSETIQLIELGLMNVYDLPIIRVVRRNGYYYAFDNRRLYVYRVLHYRGKLDKVKVKLAPLRKFLPDRFTTLNNGESVQLSLGPTLPHSNANSPPSSPEVMSAEEDDDFDLAYHFEIGLNLEFDESEDEFGFPDTLFGDDYY